MTRRKTPNEELADLTAARIENIYEESLVVWVCGGCTFTMDALHMDSDGNGWTCPLCSWHQSTADAYGSARSPYAFEGGE